MSAGGPVPSRPGSEAANGGAHDTAAPSEDSGLVPAGVRGRLVRREPPGRVAAPRPPAVRVAPDPAASWNADHGKGLKGLRRDRGLLQQDLAEAVGVPRTVLSNWENGSRRPRGEHLAALALTLRVPVGALLNSTPTDLPAAGVDGDRTRSVSDAQGAVPADQVPQVQRFLRQVAWFEREREAGWLPRRRWETVRAVAGPSGRQLSAVHGQNDQSRAHSEGVGRALATSVRAQLGLGAGPLPGLDAFAELCGLSLFRAPFTAAPRSRLRGLLIETDRHGPAVLLNTMLTSPFQRLAAAELLGRAVLQPALATAVSITASEPSARATRSNLDAAAARFARELLLPSSVVETEVALLAPAAPVDDPGYGPVQGRSGGPRTGVGRVVAALVVDLSSCYQVPAQLVLETVPRELRLAPADLSELAGALNVSRQREASRTGLDALHPTWRVGPADLPQRFLLPLLQAVLEGRASTGGVAALTGLTAPEVEDLLVSHRAGEEAAAHSPAGPGPGSVSGWSEAVEPHWLDLWHHDVA